MMHVTYVLLWYFVNGIHTKTLPSYMDMPGHAKTPPPSCFIKPESDLHCLYKCHLFCLVRPVFNLQTAQILSTSLCAPFEFSTIINVIFLNIHKWCVLKLCGRWWLSRDWLTVQVFWWRREEVNCPHWETIFKVCPNAEWVLVWALKTDMM